MYEILSPLKNDTWLVTLNGNIFVAKPVGEEEREFYSLLSVIHSEYVAPVYECAVVGGKLCSICGCIQGTTLEDYVSRKGTLDDDECREIALCVCRGLSAIHEKGVVHRDIKPSNVIIDNDGRAHIIDFGISRTIKPDAGNDTQVLGTAGYAAPEQFGFRQSSEQTDIYALGVLINFMKTGCLPNETAAEGFFAPIIEKCTAIDSADRYADARAVESALLGKGKIKRFIKSVPGFRKGVWWHSVIAGIYYFATLFLMWDGGKGNLRLTDYLLDICSVFLIMAMPAALLFDFRGIVSRLFVRGRCTPKKRRRAAVLLSCLCVLAGLFLFGLVGCHLRVYYPD